MPELCNIDTCTSCQSCYNACPFDALQMRESALSTLIPDVDVSKCRECGLCEKACPVINPLQLSYPRMAMALYTRNADDRLSCSSGGAATLFARRIIKAGGVVYGATAKNGVPRFVRVDKEEDLTLLKGSKYVFCNPGMIYKSAKADLDAGKRCLFIGLPCNVAALRRYLRKGYQNLITVDLVCHGTPPAEYLRKHLEDKIGSLDKVGDVTFRGRRDFCTTAYDINGKIVYSKNQYEDEYFASFMGAVTYKPVCYNCSFACPERVSDITIGDFWGIGSDALESYNGKISLALINSGIGEEFFLQCKDDMIWECRSVEEAIAGNHQLRHPSVLSGKAKMFRKEYETSGSLDRAFRASGVRSTTIRNKFRRILFYLPKLILNRK